MNQTNVTVVGHVATDPRLREVATGSKVTNFRLASTERRYDKGLKEWRDGGTMFFTVSCWRALAENVFSSVKKGHPVVVEGRLHVNTYDDKEGATRTVLEIDAVVVGHDLTRGVSSFTKGDPAARVERDIAGDLARELDADDAGGYGSSTDAPIEDGHVRGNGLVDARAGGAA